MGIILEQEGGKEEGSKGRREGESERWEGENEEGGRKSQNKGDRNRETCMGRKEGRLMFPAVNSSGELHYIGELDSPHTCGTAPER